MPLVEFTAGMGSKVALDTSAQATAPFGLVYQDRVSTPRGKAIVLGVRPETGDLYIQLYCDDFCSYWDCKSQRDLANMGIRPLNPRTDRRRDSLDQARVDVAVRGCSKDVKILYHQTDRDSANKILKSSRMLRGQGGSVGGGIYFAVSAADTNQKAQHKGVVLECTVWLGNQMQVSVAGDHTFTSLQAGGFDSILSTVCNGIEYVVFNYDQVLEIREM